MNRNLLRLRNISGLLISYWVKANDLAHGLWMRWKSRLPIVPQRLRKPVNICGIVLGVYLFLKALAWIIPLPQDALWRPSSTLIFDRERQLMQAFISEDDMWRIQTPLSGISPYLKRSLLGFEDRWFYFHPGVNPLALGRALVQNIAHRRIVSGGSTITMQIARMMEPKQRNLGNKLWEILRAFQLELRYSKRRLLEIYFNIAPYGGNIEGVAAASWLYFGKEPSQLSLGEAALLTAIPNSPNAFRPDVNLRHALQGRNLVLRKLHRTGVITKAEYDEASNEQPAEIRPELPKTAPHFCRDLYLNTYGETRVYSTLNRRIQNTAEDLLRLHLNSLQNEAITNGAIVVLDNRSHEILAMVGSGDFNDRLHDGQVNATLARRSPGSALKPFIYAQSMETGLVSPAHYLEDVPTDFSGYAPENYDRTFCGVVSARAALERSLNLPAIGLEQQLENGSTNLGLYTLLRKAGVTMRSRDHYGLSIAIGGCEVSLLDVTALYSAMANGGEYTKPRWLLSGREAAPIKLFDAGTAYIITDILTGLRRPDLPTCWEFTSLPQIAWKTGTSYGHRDAWSIGYNPRYTVGVWLGNFSGEGAPGLIGAEAAAPILFELMNSICRGQQIRWFKAPDSVDWRQVCSISGQPAGPYCPTAISEIYLPDRSPDKECQFHQAIQIDDLTGLRLPPDYAGERKSHTKVYLQWPARVGSWMEASGSPPERIPQLLPGWQGLLPGASPVIRSPSQDCQYRLREGIDRTYQKICLEASAGSDVHRLYWFIDGELLGTVKPGERLFYLPVPGRHRLVCQDDFGRSTEMPLVIERAE